MGMKNGRNREKKEGRKRITVWEEDEIKQFKKEIVGIEKIVEWTDIKEKIR